MSSSVGMSVVAPQPPLLDQEFLREALRWLIIDCRSGLSWVQLIRLLHKKHVHYCLIIPQIPFSFSLKESYSFLCRCLPVVVQELLKQPQTLVHVSDSHFSVVVQKTD